MATIIDELIVTLGLDPSDYTKGQKEAARSLVKTRQEADKTAKDLEVKGKQAAQFFVNLRNEAIKTFAVLAIGSGVTSFVTSTIKNFANLGYVSESLGMSARHLDGWQKAAERVGGSAAGITNQLKQSNDAVAAYHAGLGVSQDISQFLVWGGSTKDLKNGETYLLARARLLRKFSQEDPTKAAMLAGQMAVGTDEFNFLKQGSKAVLAQVAAQEKLSNASKDNISKAQELERKWLDVRNNLQSATQEIVIAAMPALQEFGDWLLQAAKWLSANRGEIQKWGKEFFDDVSNIAHAANDAAQAVGGWKTVLEGLLALKIVSFTANLLKMARALVGVQEASAGAGTGAGAGAAAGGGFWASVRGLLGGVVGRAALGTYLMAHSDSLNKGEDDWTKQMHGQTQRAKDLMTYFMQQGWSKAQAAGIVANMVRESGLDPHITGDHGQAYGLGQWHADRQANFRRWAGHDIRQSTYMEQAAFYNYELTRGAERAAGQKLREARTAADSGAAVSALAERPADRNGEMIARAKIAIGLDASYSNAAAAHLMHVTRTATAPKPVWGSMGLGQPYSNDNSTQTHIDTINIHTQATDADGIAQSAGDAFSKYNSFASQANTGLTG